MLFVAETSCNGSLTATINPGPLGQSYVTVTLGKPDHTSIVVSDTAVAGLKNVYGTDDGHRALAPC